MDDEKVINTVVWPEDGEYGDIIKLLQRTAEIVGTASQVTNEDAKKELFRSARILIDDCGKAIESRITIEPVLIEEDD